MESRTWPIVHCALARAHFTTYTGWKVSLVSAKIEKVESRSIKFVLKNFRLDKNYGKLTHHWLIRSIWRVFIIKLLRPPETETTGNENTEISADTFFSWNHIVIMLLDQPALSDSSGASPASTMVRSGSEPPDINGVNGVNEVNGLRRARNPIKVAGITMGSQDNLDTVNDELADVFANRR